jgi:hypothetical protein
MSIATRLRELERARAGGRCSSCPVFASLTRLATEPEPTWPRCRRCGRPVDHYTLVTCELPPAPEPCAK